MVGSEAHGVGGGQCGPERGPQRRCNFRTETQGGTMTLPSVTVDRICGGREGTTSHPDSRKLETVLSGLEKLSRPLNPEGFHVGSMMPMHELQDLEDLLSCSVLFRRNLQHFHSKGSMT